MRSYQALLLLAFASLTLANQYMYTFAQEWPGSVCRTQSCSSEYILNYDGSAWNLHGLWPDRQNSYSCQEISQCTAEPYQPEQLSQNTLSSMDQYWVGLYNSVDDFRSHEWTKHGTCWKGQSLYKSSSNQDSFFGTVIALRGIYNLYDGLRQAGISPDDSNLYDLADISQAIINYLKQVSRSSYVNEDMIQIQCQRDHSTGQQMLTQVYVCLDDRYSPMSCNCGNDYTRQSNGCQSPQLLYPSFNY